MEKIDLSQFEVKTQPEKQTFEKIDLSQYEVKDTVVTKEERKDDLLTAPVSTLVKSGYEFGRGMFDVVAHPIQTGKSIISLAKGTLEKVIPGEQPDEATVDAIIDFYKNRYGNLERAKDTALQDPVGFISDASMFLTGGGSALSKIGKFSKLSKLAMKTGKAIDPLSLPLRAGGKALYKVTKNREIRPFARQLDQDIIQSARNLNVEVPASVKTKGKAVPIIEAGVSKSIFGNKLADMVENAKTKLIDIADNVVAKTGKSGDLLEAGKDILKGSEKFKDEFIKIKNELYNIAFKGNEGEKIFIKPYGSLKFVDNILTQKQQAVKLLGKAQDINYFRKLKKILSGKKKINAKEYRSAVKELNERIKNFNDPFVTGNKGTLKKLSVLLQEELDDAIIIQRPEFQTAIDKANNYYSAGLNKLNSTYGKEIFKFKDKPDKIIPAILNKKTSIEDIPKIFEMIGDDNIASLQSAFLTEFFDKAKGLDKNFTPGGISKQIKSIGDNKLQKILSEDQYSKIKDLENVTIGIGKFQKVAEGSQTAFNLRAIAQASTMFTNPFLGLKIIAGDAIFSKFISSKIGQELLTEGIRLSGETGLKITETGSQIRKASPILRSYDIIKQE